MTGHISTDLTNALFIAVGFAALGRLLLSPQAIGIFAWNDSFLAGAGICAAVLFPLSVVFPNHALRIIWVMLTMAIPTTAFVQFRRWRNRERGLKKDSNGIRKGSRLGAIGCVALILVIVATSIYAFTNERWRYGWDGFQIWATKAQVLYYQGGLSPEPQISLDSQYLGRNSTYPALVPLYEALMWMTYGKFDFDISKGLFLFLYLSLLLNTYRLARALTNVQLGLVAAALVSWLPAVSTGESIGGYADIPLACFIVAAVSSLVESSVASGWRSPAPWLIGSLLMVKDEGILLIVIISFAILLTWFSLPLKRTWRRIADNWKAIAIIGMLVLLRVGYLKWLGFNDSLYRPINGHNLLRAMNLLGTVARLCSAHFLSFQQFGFLWPAFFVFGGILFVKGAAKERAVVAGIILTVLAYTCPFLFTTWEISSHVSTAYDRLLSQLAPVASACVIAGYDLVRSARPTLPTAPTQTRNAVEIDVQGKSKSISNGPTLPSS